MLIQEVQAPLERLLKLNAETYEDKINICYNGPPAEILVEDNDPNTPPTSVEDGGDNGPPADVLVELKDPSTPPMSVEDDVDETYADVDTTSFSGEWLLIGNTGKTHLSEQIAKIGDVLLSIEDWFATQRAAQSQTYPFPSHMCGHIIV